MGKNIQWEMGNLGQTQDGLFITILLCKRACMELEVRETKPNDIYTYKASVATAHPQKVTVWTESHQRELLHIVIRMLRCSSPQFMVSDHGAVGKGSVFFNRLTVLQ